MPDDDEWAAEAEVVTGPLGSGYVAAIEEEIAVTVDREDPLNDPRVATPGRVRQIALPPAARALGTLSHVDDEDAFLVETGPAGDRTGEEWARAMLEDAPVRTRKGALQGVVRARPAARLNPA